MKRQPTATHYLDTYPVAVKLWREGKQAEAVANFVKSPCNLIIKGEDKAVYYADNRQAAIRQLKAAHLHEQQTDALCKGLWECAKNWPAGGPLLETNAAYMATTHEINVRRGEWQKLYGIHAGAKRLRLNAIRLKKFARIMRLMDKQA